MSWDDGTLDFGPRDRSIQERFEKFHRANPRVYSLILLYSRQVKARGYAHYSINAIFERIRWHVFIETRSEDDFKLSNDYRSRYARLVMEQEPDLADFFELRELRSA